MKNPIDLIKAYPRTVVVVAVALFIAIFGAVGLVSSIVAVFLITFFAYILAGNDDDWFDPRGPRAA